MNVNKKAAKM